MDNRRAGLLVMLVVLIADQLAKWTIITPLRLPVRGEIELLPIFALRWVENHGVSMGFLTANDALGRWLLVAMTGAIAVAVAAWLSRESKRVDALALGAILGGAIGNIADRVRLGYVVDFLDLHFGTFRPFLVFNVADAAISIGVVLLVLRAFFARDRHAPRENVHD